MAGYMKSTQVGAHLDALAAAHPTFCTRSGPADWGPGRVGASSGYVKIAASTPDSPPARWGVLLTGGVHARELAPPDALVSLLEKMVAAYAAKTSITYPSWTDPVGGIVYDAFTIPWPWVRKVVENLDLYVAPLVNDDGRDFALTPLPPGTSVATQELHKGWRKNRRPAPGGSSDPRAVGVDLNRNFDILWDFKKAYAAYAVVVSSTDPVEETYIGPTADGAEAEPETKNVAGLMRTKDISFFIDFHAYSRDVLFEWGIEANQSSDEAMNFRNPAWNGKRDGVEGLLTTAYSEYIPTDAAAAGRAMAQRISDLVFTKAGGSDARAQARSRYTVKSAANLYVASGTSMDYCFSRWFTAAAQGTPIKPVMAFTIEVGGDPKLGADHDEGGFTPDYVQHFPKLEREIHVAAWAFLTAVAATNMVPASAPPAPAATPNCFVAGAAYGDPWHPDVVFLRDLRDRQLRAGALGDAFATALVAVYEQVGPGLADRVGPHPATRRAVRGALLAPFVRTLRRVSRSLQGWPGPRAAALALVFVLASPVLGTGLALAALVAWVASRRSDGGGQR